MKQKQLHLRNASFSTLFFVLLGYAVKFYPHQLVAFDTTIQNWIRGELSPFWTAYWTKVTLIGNAPVIVVISLVLAAFFYFYKRWKIEAYFLIAELVGLALTSTLLKYVYQRPRPSIEWLLQTVGYSYPSWHTASTMLVAGVVVVIAEQRIKHPLSRYMLQGSLLFMAVLVAISRVYIGVHYPTDIIGGWLLAFSLLAAIYPYYDRKRFEWRFQGKQG